MSIQLRAHPAPRRHRRKRRRKGSVTLPILLDHGKVDSVKWCKVRTFKSPHVEGWIRAEEFTSNYLKSGPRTTFVLRAVPAESEYYSSSAELYRLRGGKVQDTAMFTQCFNGSAKMTFVENHVLENIDCLIRYETEENVEGVQRYYQDFMAYRDGDMVPLVFTESMTVAGDTADTEEYTIYMPRRDSFDEVILAPVPEGGRELSMSEAEKKQFSYTDDISIPIDQCIIKFYEKASHKGKLKRRTTEVFHWNGVDLARMFGDDIDFEQFEPR